MTPNGLAPSSAAAGLSRRIDLSALATLFWLAVRQHCRPRKLLWLGLLFSLPAAIAVGVRIYQPSDQGKLEFPLVFLLLPHALVPLAALLFATGMIQDEIEDQTLTYLLVRPLPRWAVYTTKLLATVLVTSLLVGIFTGLTYAAIDLGSEDFWKQEIPLRAVKAALLFGLALVAYCAIFGCLSLFVRRTLIIGLGYIFIFEGVMASFDFVARRLTIMYYFRTLVERWLGLSFREWSINLNDAPTASESVQILLGASLAATVVAVVVFTTREFRVKTPEGN
jgi:ABC-2 type transport system permease protein